MLWTCMNCGFYNDQQQDQQCCNCGKTQTFELDTNDVPDLLASTYNAQITLDTLEDHNAPTTTTTTTTTTTATTTTTTTLTTNNKISSALGKPEVKSTTKSTTDLTQAFDGMSDGYSILETTNLQTDEEEGMHHPPKKDNSTSSSNKNNPQYNNINTNHPSQLQHQYDDLDPLQSELSYTNDTTISITTDHYSQSSTLRFSILNYSFVRVLFFYLTANFTLALVSIVMTAILTVSILVMSFDFPKDSFLDKFSDFAAYTLLIAYFLYVIVFIPPATFIYQRGASLWSRETPLLSPTTFVDYLSSHAPALTTPQIDAISNHFILSQAGKDVIVFLNITPQFKTRNSIVGIHYIPATNDNDYNFDTLDHLTSPSPTLENNSQKLSRTISTLTAQPFFIQSWGENPSVLKYLKISQIVSFLFFCEPVIMPIILSCCINCRKYGVNIFKK